MPTVAVLVNPTSGKGRGGKVAPDLAASLHRKGIDAAMIIGTTAREALEMTRGAVAEGVDAVIAAGGDGTVNLALQAVVHTDTPLGVVPVGTGNDNARMLGLPTDIDGCVDVISAFQARCIDAAHVTTADGSSRYFMGVMSSGFDSQVNETANTMRWPTGESRYFIGILKEITRFKALPYRVTVDGHVIEGKGMLVAVGNGSTYGGGMRVCEGAKADDGLLTLTWLHDMSKVKFLRTFPSVYKGTHITQPEVQQHEGRDIHLDAPDQIAYADGERIGPLPATVTIHPHRVHVLLPPDSPLGTPQPPTR